MPPPAPSPPDALSVQRLGPSHRERARALFAMMSETFGEDQADLSDAYLDRLLGRDDFWALAARAGEEDVGGLTAHVLPMTRAESEELFLYDIAVREDHQRRGVGRLLVDHLRRAAADAGIDVVFVAADVADAHALDFYRALGGAESPVAIFTFERGAREEPAKKR